jgi:hypothetical protein
VTRSRSTAGAAVTEHRVALALVLLLTLARSALFVFKSTLAFDSDQAIFGLMAKHIAAGRAFPLFMYGTNYILAVEAWLAAAVFAVAGASVAALKLPLLLMNAAIAVLLFVLLEREAGLRPRYALVASLFFILVPPGTATELLAPIGGNVEPLLYVLLLWLARRRPVLFGLILGVGFLQREFTIYGAVAVVVVELISGNRGRDDVRRWLAALRVAVEVWLVVQILRPFASAAGPGTTVADLMTQSNNLANLFGRVCFDVGGFGLGLQRLVTIHWPLLFGSKVVRVDAFLVESDVVQGVAWSGLALGAAALLMVGRIATHAPAVRAQWTPCRFPAYLLLVGTCSALGYAASRCGQLSLGTMRYDLLSLVGAVGLAGLFFVVEPARAVRASVVFLVLVWAAVPATAHAKLWVEALTHPVVPRKLLIIRSLDARGIRYATADYWIAYYTTFLTNERIIVAADAVGRIPVYADEVNAHRAQAVHISRTACGDRHPVIEGVFFCPLAP